jgi:hypothetical protein
MRSPIAEVLDGETGDGKELIRSTFYEHRRHWRGWATSQSKKPGRLMQTRLVNLGSARAVCNGQLHTTSVHHKAGTNQCGWAHSGTRYEGASTGAVETVASRPASMTVLR